MKLSEQYKIINRFCKSAPVDLFSMASALGVKVHKAYLKDSLSGMLERRRSGQFQITINAHHPMTRQRFTLAHELGHYMLHRHLVGDGIADDRAYRSTEDGQYNNTLIGPTEETEANKFAANILMPGALIEKVKGKVKGDDNSDTAELARKDDNSDTAELARKKAELARKTAELARKTAELARKFEVSEHSMSIRLGRPYKP